MSAAKQDGRGCMPAPAEDSAAMSLDAIRSDFEMLDDWEDKYRYVIELGRALPPFPEALRAEANKVRGCASQVWLAASVDWKMSATLSQALAILRSRGWRPSKSPFYGTVQAFGATPPTPRPHDVRQGYRPAPDPADLLTQISAFCSQGAQAILAYAWNDGQPDRPLQLSTSPELRLALAKGYRACQRRWTNDERSKDLA